MVAVVANSGIPLMPTSNARARILLRKGRAVIFCRDPFTIKIIDRETGSTQPVEYKSDVGYKHVGISICSEKHEYVSEQRDIDIKETEHHNDARKFRRTRRNRKRYRAPRFNNRKIPEGWLPPSIRHRMESQVEIYRRYAKVMPITRAVFEMGKFDTQLLKAVESGSPVPQGTDYQQGERYQYETLRQAVFSRDKYTCQICGKGIGQNAVLRIHHIGFWKGDRTNRMPNLLTVCTGCHTSKNHKPGGKLYKMVPKLKPFKGATFMTAVRWQMLHLVKAVDTNIDVHIQYGAKTKLARQMLGINKSHANDAYAIGDFHPKHRKHTIYLQKRRRNSRCLEKFYDARFIDSRDKAKKSGASLSCGRTNRKTPRNNPQSERKYRCRKVSKGKRVIRQNHYMIQPGTILIWDGRKYKAKGVHGGGVRVMLDTGKSVSLKDVSVAKYAGGWVTA